MAGACVRLGVRFRGSEAAGAMSLPGSWRLVPQSPHAAPLPQLQVRPADPLLANENSKNHDICKC